MMIVVLGRLRDRMNAARYSAATSTMSHLATGFPNA